jgi:hypothetical protein
MPGRRRARPTIRCLTEDLRLSLPPDDADLDGSDDPWLAALRQAAPTSPLGQERVSSIGGPAVYWLRTPLGLAATWADDQHDVVWLCAARRWGEGSDDEVGAWLARLHAASELLPSARDVLRDRAETDIRLRQFLARDLLQLADHALAEPGIELSADLGGYLPCRALLVHGGITIRELWCALGVRGADGSTVPRALRDYLFAALAARYPDADLEARTDWPAGGLGWSEAVRLELR